MEYPKNILFLCTGNSCRSQMAEGFARKYAPDGIGIYSAGVRADGMNPYMKRVMSEVSIDVSKQSSKTLAEIPEEKIEAVFTLCDHAAQHCPHFPGEVIREHWGVNDPADATGTDEEIMAVYRKVRDGIEKRIREYFQVK